MKPLLLALRRHHVSSRLALFTAELEDHVVAQLRDFRIGDIADSTLIGARIATQTRILCASPAYLARAGAPAALADLCHHRLIDKLHGAAQPARVTALRAFIGHPPGWALNAAASDE